MLTVLPGFALALYTVWRPLSSVTRMSTCRGFPPFGMEIFTVPFFFAFCLAATVRFTTVSDFVSPAAGSCETTTAFASSIELPSLDVMVPTASFREESVFFASESVMPTTLGMLTFCFILMTILTRVPFVVLLPGSGLWEMMISDGLSGSLPFSTAPIVSPSLSRRSFA